MVRAEGPIKPAQTSPAGRPRRSPVGESGSREGASGRIGAHNNSWIDLMRYQCGVLVVWAVCLMGVGVGALAQTPDKDRETSLMQSQQRVEFRRNASVDADRRAKEGARKLTAARDRLQAAEKEVTDARIGLKRAEEDLEYDRSRAADARKAYDDESANFQTLRRGQ